MKPLYLFAARSLVAAAVLFSPLPAALAGAGETALTLTRESRTVELSLDDLAALPQTVVTTENEFSDGEVAYSGPLVREVLAGLGLDQDPDATLRFTAANDYYVDIPSKDFRDYDVILAMQADGKALSRRDKGPLWLMYPITGHPDLADPKYLQRLIWQVVRIESL